ncbi:MAG: L-seryl-tRNA(Sec) selenium transferase [Deltaproteobacteria bacterium]|nr:L-seryl-tRNA(Sec) selenium transferase [Deltaproteobacteria bacterium]
MPEVQQRLRGLPAVEALLQQPAIRALIEAHGRAAVVRAARAVVEQARRRILDGGEAAVDEQEIARRLAADAAMTLRSVINASGVVVHTNLGRAPLAGEAIAAVAGIAAGYSTLEYDLAAGERGNRHCHAIDLLRELTGAADAVVVNNNAGAVLLALSALARDGDVVVSRGELVEIGGGFRVPDVMRQSGARLVEVGTTNRTHRFDYEQAIGEQTRLLLKVHQSNFAQIGFVSGLTLGELVAIGRQRGVAVLYDAGSGCLRPLAGLTGEPTVADGVALGADLVCFSGDKLLGGPQAGVVVGRADLIERLRCHPLMRALRPDKLCLSALQATLQLWRDRPERVPVAGMIAAPAARLERRAQEMARAIGAAAAAGSVDSVRCVDRVGGGASPLSELPGWAVAVRGVDVERLAAALRGGEPPVVPQIADGALLLHLRCVAPEQDSDLAAAVVAALNSLGKTGA